MTPAEKTRLLAERVMGWKRHNFKNENCLPISFWRRSDGTHGAHGSWPPLTNLAHAGEVLEAMIAKGYEFDAQDCGVGKYKAWFRAPGIGAQAYAPLLSTAICHAALMAEGVKEEEL